VVTDVRPDDHPHHLGVSVAMADVNGVNLWGGRTYVRDLGYTWRDDHGRVEHVAWLARTRSRLANRMRWLGVHGETLLEEERTFEAVLLEKEWRLDTRYTLTNPNPTPVTLGSPGTNGRPGKAGYGGFLWRLPPGVPLVLDPASAVEEEVNGSTAAWVAAVGPGEATPAYTLVFTGLGEGDRWFVRAQEYPGVCVALAFDRVRTIEPGQALERRHHVVVADGARTREQIEALVATTTA
jgi:hypothetical protein